MATIKTLLLLGFPQSCLMFPRKATYAVKALFRDLVTGTLKKDQDLDSLVAYFTEYVICPGLRSVPVVESTVKRAWGFL